MLSEIREHVSNEMNDIDTKWREETKVTKAGCAPRHASPMVSQHELSCAEARQRVKRPTETYSLDHVNIQECSF